MPQTGIKHRIRVSASENGNKEYRHRDHYSPHLAECPAAGNVIGQDKGEHRGSKQQRLKRCGSQHKRCRNPCIDIGIRC